MPADPPSPTRRAVLAAAAPVVAAVGVFGVSYGVLATSAGMPLWQPVLASALIFAGSAQFATVAALAQGASPAAAIASGVLLNSRYLATGAATGAVLRGPRWQRAIQSQLVVDESYAVGVGFGRDGLPHPEATVVAGVALWLAWVAGTVIGALLGPVLGDPVALGLDAAFPALFVALLWPSLSRASARRAALAGAATAGVLALVAPPGVPLAAAAAAGLLVGGRRPPGDADPDPLGPGGATCS